MIWVVVVCVLLLGTGLFVALLSGPRGPRRGGYIGDRYKREKK